MPSSILWLFLGLAVVFTLVHNFAVFASLYWYYSWFDIVMHVWGGILVSLGVFALSSLRSVRIKPTIKITLGVLALIMIAWEVFEYTAGLYNPDTYIFDTAKDIIFGLSGGLLGYFLLQYFRIKT
jgi:glucan phosphoethanolaminetransferase (alkaline phosphatase superfamily)